MSTRLTHAAASAKQFGLAMLFVLPIFVIGRITWGVIAEATKPKPTPTPTYVNPGYNVLPPLILPSDTKRSNEATITLNTPNLQLPTPTYNMPTVPVLRYNKRTTNFDYINNLNEIAGILNLTEANTSQISPTIFRLSESSADGIQAEVDIRYYHLHYKYKNPAAYIPIERGGTVEAANAYNQANELFGRLHGYLETFRNNQNAKLPPKLYEADYAYRSLDGTIQEVTSKNQANITEIKIPRNMHKDIPFISPSTVDPNMKYTYTEQRATVSSGGENRARLIQADIIYFPLDETSIAENVVYPIRPLAQAYSELLAGKGFILSPSEPGVEYLILKAYLAYYEPREYMEYVTPVWVFEGDTVADPNFLFRAIVPAIATGWIQEQ